MVRQSLLESPEAEDDDPREELRVRNEGGFCEWIGRRRSGKRRSGEG